jgi:hypothetical protein
MSLTGFPATPSRPLQSTPEEDSRVVAAFANLPTISSVVARLVHMS